MADRKGECCIARWGGGGHMSAGGYSTSKMDMIMLKFRPIAPKPVAGTTTVSGGSSDSSKGGGSGGGSGSGRGRRKSSNNNNKRCTSSNNNGKKRKSASPDKNCYDDHDDHNQMDQKTDLTLLPLFPEAPDLSPSNYNHQVNNNIGDEQQWVKFDKNCYGSTPYFEDNYNNCHGSVW